MVGCELVNALSKHLIINGSALLRSEPRLTFQSSEQVSTILSKNPSPFFGARKCAPS